MVLRLGFRGCGLRTSATPSRRAAPSPSRKSRPCTATKSRACSLAQAGPAAPAGNAGGRRPAALPAGVGRSRAEPAPQRRVALPVPARLGGRTRVQASRPRASPGLASAAAPDAGGPGFCPPLGLAARDDAGRRSLGEQRGVGNAVGRGDRQCGPAPRLPDAGRLRCRVPGWAWWRCPGARRPRGANRLDPGGPAAGRQFHGWFGAR